VISDGLTKTKTGLDDRVIELETQARARARVDQEKLENLSNIGAALDVRVLELETQVRGRVRVRVSFRVSVRVRFYKKSKKTVLLL
jgi:hypothetical protein